MKSLGKICECKFTDNCLMCHHHSTRLFRLIHAMSLMPFACQTWPNTSFIILSLLYIMSFITQYDTAFVVSCVMGLTFLHQMCTSCCNTKLISTICHHQGNLTLWYINFAHDSTCGCFFIPVVFMPMSQHYNKRYMWVGHWSCLCCWQSTIFGLLVIKWVHFHVSCMCTSASTFFNHLHNSGQSVYQHEHFSFKCLQSHYVDSDCPPV